MSDSEAIIRVTDVWKKFTIQRGRAGDLRERFAALRAPKNEDVFDTELWALKDVSFSVGPGRSLGIVGHNGSGKSTLLKLLTGILKPTRGDVKMKGRVGALIEVGAGFHPELSGRENIYLNGSILGLSRREIERKFDDIVSFAALEQFIDTPVKRYSSGMYMRLGFAVAAHTDPDILLIDEVLAVGDTFFQRKCMRYLEEFVRRGGAVILVSHAMGQVADLCETCLWLDHGELKFHGPTREVIHQYMELVMEREEAEFRRNHPEEWAAREAEREEAEQRESERREAEQQERERRETEQQERERREEEEARRAAAARAEKDKEQEDKEQEDKALRDKLSQEEMARRAAARRGRLRGLTLRDASGRPATRFEAGDPLRVEIYYRRTGELPNPAFCFEVFRQADGMHMFTTSNFDHDLPLLSLPTEGMVSFHISFMSLNAGDYTVRLRLYSDWKIGDWDAVLEDEITEAASFTVEAGRFAHGCVYLPVEWDDDAHSVDTAGRRSEDKWQEAGAV